LFAYPQTQAYKMNNYYEVCRQSSEEQSFTLAFYYVLIFSIPVKTKEFSFSFHLFLCYLKDLHLPFPW